MSRKPDNHRSASRIVSSILKSGSAALVVTEKVGDDDNFRVSVGYVFDPEQAELGRRASKAMWSKDKKENK